MHTADLIIVGAGMVGSSLALALQGSGLSVALVDASPLQVQPFSSQAPFEPRVSALSLASQRILERLGAWSGIKARRLAPYTDMQVWDGLGTGSVHFSAGSVHADVLGHIVENQVVQDALLEQLLPVEEVSLMGGAGLSALERSGELWTVTLSNGERLQAPLVVGADGARSSVRRLAGCETREWDYFHHAIVTSVRCELPHQNTAWQRFTPEGPLAFLPLQRDTDARHWCSIVWSCPAAEAQRLMALESADFAQELGRTFEHRLGAVLDVDPRLCVPLRQRHAKRYVQPGLALIGDAAHSIHPLAGQGVNLGFLDAATLAEVLVQAKAAGQSIASLSVLNRFERRRMPQNLAMMAAMEGLERLFQSDSLGVRLLRNFGLKQVESHYLAKAFFMRRALGISGDIPELAQA